MYFQHATVYIWSFCHFDFTTHLDFSDMIGFFLWQRHLSPYPNRDQWLSPSVTGDL